MSMFNTEIICMTCKKEERESSRYEEALAADQEAVRQGDYNFKGIDHA